MAFESAFQGSLDVVASSATELLQFLDQQPQSNELQPALPSDPFQNASPAVHKARKKLVGAALQLAQLGTRPPEYLEHLANSYQNLTCIRWLIDLDVIEHIPRNGSSISYSELAAKAGVPKSQIIGVARMAIVHDFLQEPSPNHIAHNRISALLAREESFMSWARWMVNYSVPVAFKFPEASKQWGETDVKHHTAYSLAMDTELPFFDHLRETPGLATLFSSYMRNVSQGEPFAMEHSFGGFDWASLPPGSKVVDVGGSHGLASLALAKQFPQLEFIVQDLEETAAEAEQKFRADKSVDPAIASRIQFMAHDFFQPQPVTDADVYFLRMICHDWPDKDALVILQHLRDVLAKRPSARILIMDTVLPFPGTTPLLQERSLRVRDLTMMQVFNAKERELEDWKALAKQMGLEVSRVEQPDGSVMALLTMQSQGINAGADNGWQEVNAKDAGISRHDSPVSDPEIVNSSLSEGTSEAEFSSATKPVLIIGGGIAGLCLAQALKKNGIDFHVFERDAAVDSRPQGYRLKIEANASEALLESLPADVYHAFETSCALTAVGETDFNPFTGQVIKSRAGGGLSGKLGLQPTYTVDRRAFRAALMSGIEDHISFGRELASYTIDETDGTVHTTFKDGTQVQGSFLAGADGLHSLVRQQHVPQHRIVDTGAVCVYGKTNLTPDIVDRFPDKGLRWMTIVSDEPPMLQSALIGTNPLTLLMEPIRFSAASRAQHDLPADYLYWALIGPKERFGPPDGAPQKVASAEQAAMESARLSVAVTREWHPSIRSLFELQDPRQASVIRVASTVSEIEAWESSAQVTLLGDAIHPMSPCGGVGANTAIQDSTNLAKVLTAANKKPTVEAVAEYEAAMRQRAFKSIFRAEIGSRLMFGGKPLNDCPLFTTKV